MKETKKKEDKFDKVKKKLLDANYVADILEEQIKENENKEIITLNLTVNQPPESYARERKGRGKHFYNPKGDKMTAIREILLDKIPVKDKLKLETLFKNENASYYVYLDIKYYIPIQKSSSIKEAILKELGSILPEGRPDIDNYDKFILDTLHEVAYHDDSHVVRIHSEKRYSLNPRTEITAQIKINKE